MVLVITYVDEYVCRKLQPAVHTASIWGNGTDVFRLIPKVVPFSVYGTGREVSRFSFILFTILARRGRCEGKYRI
jgi:hypothetical protein